MLKKNCLSIAQFPMVIGLLVNGQTKQSHHRLESSIISTEILQTFFLVYYNFSLVFIDGLWDFVGVRSVTYVIGRVGSRVSFNSYGISMIVNQKILHCHTVLYRLLPYSYIQEPERISIGCIDLSELCIIQWLRDSLSGIVQVIADHHYFVSPNPGMVTPCSLGVCVSRTLSLPACWDQTNDNYIS